MLPACTCKRGAGSLTTTRRHSRRLCASTTGPSDATRCPLRPDRRAEAAENPVAGPLPSRPDGTACPASPGDTARHAEAATARASARAAPDPTVSESSRRPAAAVCAAAEDKERARLGETLGIQGVTSSDAAALLDPRGRHFQRLEWLGDSTLDVLVARHLLVAACCPSRTQADLCSDRQLARRVRRERLACQLDWGARTDSRTGWRRRSSSLGAVAAGQPRRRSLSGSSCPGTPPTRVAQHRPRVGSRQRART